MKATLFLSVVVISMVIGGRAYGVTKIMPSELVEFAEKSSCVQVSDFYDREGAVGPPFVYGYLPGNTDDSVAFWCKSAEFSKYPYRLMVLVRNSDLELQELTECPSRIRWHNFPGGLSIAKFDKNRRETLKGFMYLDDPHRKVPENVRLSHNGILGSYDGVTGLFYCYRGEWLVAQGH